MKAISLWQPWASLWLSPRKVHETRPKRWPVKRGQWLAVHAAKSIETLGLGIDLPAILDEEFGTDWRRTLPTGALIGAVLIEGIYRTEDVVRCYGGWKPHAKQAHDDLACGNFASGRVAMKRGVYHRLAQPVPWRGQQVLFDVPDELFGEVLALRNVTGHLLSNEVPA